LRPKTANPIPTKPRRVSAENASASLNLSKSAEKISSSKLNDTNSVNNQEIYESEWVSNVCNKKNYVNY
jgi:hypothetical protein